MPIATDTNTTSRRTALGIGFAATAAALLPVAALASADAHLIKSCADLMSVEDELTALFHTFKTIEDEDRGEAEMTALLMRQQEIENHLSSLDGPATVAGAAALARLGKSRWRMYDTDGALLAGDCDEWIAASVYEFVAAMKA